MNLYDDKELFDQAILQASEKLNINPAIIEKDYYVTLLLRNLVTHEPNIVFKGGTSLSKCYKLIKRFSEDIDLNYDNHGKKLTERMRKNLSKIVAESGSVLQLELVNSEEIKSRREFNKYMFQYESSYALGTLKPLLIVETSIAIKPFPTEVMQADSYIHQYLKAEGYYEFIKKYELEPFDVVVQTKERTFVDKLFAICDYYIQNKTDEHSRHLYDIHKLYSSISFDEKFEVLIEEVRLIRKTSKMCPSAQDDYDLLGLLQEIIEKDIYKKDYENITQDLLFEEVDYNLVISTLREFLKLNIF